MNIQKKVSSNQTNKTPVMVTIIAILTIVAGSIMGVSIGIVIISGVASSLFFPLPGIQSNIFGDILLYKLLLSLSIPAVLIIGAINLLQMRKWALYAFLALLTYLVVTNIIKFSIPAGLSYIIIYILIAIYLWSIRKQFN